MYTHIYTCIYVAKIDSNCLFNAFAKSCKFGHDLEKHYNFSSNYWKCAPDLNPHHIRKFDYYFLSAHLTGMCFNIIQPISMEYKNFKICKLSNVVGIQVFSIQDPLHLKPV